MSNFEERLLVELRKTVTDEPVEPGRKSPVRRFALAGGLAAVLAAAATAIVLTLSTDTQAAYAVTKNADGTVTVEIDSLSDAAGLQAKLRDAGLNAVVAYLPAGKACEQPWFTPIGRPAGAFSTQSGVEHVGSGGIRFTISANIPAEATVVISTQTGPGREQALAIAFAQGQVPPCEVVDAPAGSGPLGGPPVGGGTQSGQG